MYVRDNMDLNIPHRYNNIEGNQTAQYTLHRGYDIEVEYLDEHTPSFANDVFLSKTIQLKAHQKTILQRCIDFENKSIQLKDIKRFQQVAREGDTLRTRVAILGDRVGSGKSFVLMALIHINNIHHKNGDMVRSFGDSMLKFTFQSDKVPLTTNILVIPHVLIKQWKQYVEMCDIIFQEDDWVLIHRNRILDTYIDNAGAPEDIARIRNKRLIVITSSMYNRFAQYTCRHNLCFQRVIYDEVDSLNIPNCKTIDAQFYWLVTASYGNLLYPRGYHSWVRDLQRYEWYASGMRCAGFIRSLLIDLGSYIPHSMMKVIVIKNSERYVEHSMRLPEIVYHIVRCRTPFSINVLNGIVDKTIIECLNADDIGGAIEHINPSHRSSEMNIINIMVERYMNTMHNYHLRYNMMEQMVYHSEQDKLHELDKMRKVINELQQKIDAIRGRIADTNMCPICCDDIQNKSVVNCCNNAFCFKCINVWFMNRSSCPMCNEKINQNDLYVIEERTACATNAMMGDSNEYGANGSLGNVTSGFLSPSPHVDKYENLKRLLEEMKGRCAKVLLFSNYDTSFYKALPIMEELGIKYEQLRGNGNQIHCAMNRYKREEVNLLAINSRFYGSGLNLENTTDIIMFHKFDSEVEKQVIGRAQRMGREKALKVWYLLYDNEIHNGDVAINDETPVET